MNVLDTQTLVSVLLHHRIIDPGELAPSVALRSEQRRNNTWHLSLGTDADGGGRSIVVKQMRVGARDEMRGLIAEIAGLENEVLRQSACVPDLLGWDEAGGWFATADCRGPTLSDILLARHLDGADTGRDAPVPEALPGDPLDASYAPSGRRLGDQIRIVLQAVERSGLDTVAPLPFGVRFALGQIPRTSRAYRELGRVSDRLELAARASAWNVDTSIHGDLRPDNLRFGADGLRVLDWELSGRGAVGWDMAMLVSHLIADRGVLQGQIHETDISPATLFAWLKHCRPFLSSLLVAVTAPQKLRVGQALHWLPLTLVQAAVEFQKQDRLSVSGLLLSQLAETLVTADNPLGVLLGEAGETAP